MGGRIKGMLEVVRDQTVEVSHAEGKSLNRILTALGSHGAFKPKNMVGFGTKVMAQKRHE